MKFVADLGGNHNQDAERLKKLVVAAAGAGCHAVKIQMFRAENVWSDPEVIARMKGYEFPPEFLPQLHIWCQDFELELHATPFDIDAVEFVSDFVDEYKISSFDILWLNLIRACGAQGLPLTLSFGRATVEEQLRAVETAVRSGAKEVNVYHCVSQYPARMEECNFSEIPAIKNRFRGSVNRVGWSDHTDTHLAIYMAVAMGAEAVEFHLDLNDGKGREFEHGHCWMEKNAMGMIRVTRDIVLTSLLPPKNVDMTELLAGRTDPATGRRP